MPDIKKVIASLEMCERDGCGFNCTRCHYETDTKRSCIENLMHDALELLKEQKETISTKEKAIEEYETVLKPDIDSIWTRYAIKKQGRYMESFKHGTANWVIGVPHAHLFSDKEMSESFARITHGTVVEIIIAIKK